MSRGQFKLPIVPYKPKIVMAVIRRPLRLFVPGLGRPCSGKVKEAVPMDSISLSREKFYCTFQTECLNFFRAKRRRTNLQHPHRLASYFGSFIDSIWPFLNTPMI